MNSKCHGVYLKKIAFCNRNFIPPFLPVQISNVQGRERIYNEGNNGDNIIVNDSDCELSVLFQSWSGEVIIPNSPERGWFRKRVITEVLVLDDIIKMGSKPMWLVSSWKGKLGIKRKHHVNIKAEKEWSIPTHGPSKTTGKPPDTGVSSQHHDYGLFQKCEIIYLGWLRAWPVVPFYSIHGRLM